MWYSVLIFFSVIHWLHHLRNLHLVIGCWWPRQRCRQRSAHLHSAVVAHLHLLVDLQLVLAAVAAVVPHHAVVVVDSRCCRHPDLYAVVLLAACNLE